MNNFYDKGCHITAIEGALASVFNTDALFRYQEVDKQRGAFEARRRLVSRTEKQSNEEYALLMDIGRMAVEKRRLIDGVIEIDQALAECYSYLNELEVGE